MISTIVVLFIAVFLSAFFSGMEIAFVTCNKLKIELDKKNGAKYAKLFSNLISKPDKFISAMLVGNNIFLVVYGILMADFLKPHIIQIFSNNIVNDSIILVLQIIISAVFILLLTEFIPKVLFQINPNHIIKLFAFPAVIAYYLLYPVVGFISWISTKILFNIMGISPHKAQYSFQKVDLENYLEESAMKEDLNSVVEPEVQIFQNAMAFPKIKVRECMIPRTEIVAIDVKESIQNLVNKFVETELSRILVYADNIDNVIGYVHSHEMFKSPKLINDVLLTLPIVPETMPVNSLLTIFIQQRKGIALVVDEFGGTAGLITMEDIIEEIFGEIEDEYDIPEFVEKKLSDSEYIFSGRLEIDYLNKKYHLHLPVSTDYETLGGMIVSKCHNIPQKNDEILVDKFQFSIIEVAETHVQLVKLKFKAD